MNKDIKKAKADALKLEEAGEFRSALEKYQEIVKVEKENVGALFKVGEIYHQLGELPAAMSAYFRVTDIEPEHKKANVKIEMIKSIMDYFNPDLYNP